MTYPSRKQINKYHVWSTILIALLAYTGCKDDTSSLYTPSSDTFVYVEGQKVGLDFTNTLTPNEQQNIVSYLYYYNGAGVAIADLDNDGYEDIFLASNEGADQLYQNLGNWQFENKTMEAGIKSTKDWSTGVAIADVNNDGLKDIYVCKVQFDAQEEVSNKLYLNRGNWTFEEKAKDMGLAFRGYSTMASFIDYDHDGDLDMYLLNHNVHSVRSYGTVEKRALSDSLAGDLFFENKISEGLGFVDVTTQAGIYNSPLGYGLAITTIDVNGDGWEDIYIGNDFHENDYLYINNGNKTFREVSSRAFGHTTQFSMGVDIADINSDGHLDIFTTDMLPYDASVAMKSAGEDTDEIRRIKEDLGFGPQTARNHLQLSNGDGTYADVGYLTGTYATDWSWSVLAYDFNQNSLTDLFITNGIVHRPNDLDYINYINNYNNTAGDTAYLDMMRNMPSEPLPNIFFSQLTDLRFTEVAQSGLGPNGFSTGAAYGDLDNDGDMDIITNNINAQVGIYQNQSNQPAITIANGESNYPMEGSRIEIFFDNTSTSLYVNTTRGFLSTSSERVTIPVGQGIDSIKVRWPDGYTYTTAAPKAGDIVKAERQIIGKVSEPRTPARHWVSTDMIHYEDGFVDDKKEKGIIERLGMDGPAVVFEDFDGDGFKDLFLGGASQFESQMFYGSGDGSFQKVVVKDCVADMRYEDVAAATIDFDKDGDLDLYVVSGGNHAAELDKDLEDRLYLNNGNREFKRVPMSLPHTNGSCIAIADIDNDGYQDLFVGARSIPGSYGLSPYSFILKNRAGTGVDIVAKHRFGMVTDASWADLNKDQSPDLILCGDYMPVTVLINENGEMFDFTKALGLSEHKGMWNTIEVSDINKDGTPDILVGNDGLNHKWQVGTENPLKLYLGDFDQNGFVDPIVFYPFLGQTIPMGGLSGLAGQLPSLKKTFSSYKAFDQVRTMEDLLPEYKEQLIEIKEVNCLSSGAFMSKGDGTYQFEPFPEIAQRSSMEDIEIRRDTIFFIGNTDSYVAEIGPLMSQSGGWMTLGSTTTPFSASGTLHLPADIKARKLIDHDNQWLVATHDGPVYRSQ